MPVVYQFRLTYERSHDGTVFFSAYQPTEFSRQGTFYPLATFGNVAVAFALRDRANGIAFRRVYGPPESLRKWRKGSKALAEKRGRRGAVAVQYRLGILYQ
jgi:hypothetical protein